ncbi:MAG: radical SAM protein [Chitinophagaceae bacterium]
MDTNSLKCNTLVMKVASRCNLNCTYCYMYNMGDSTYKNQPKVMSDAVVDAIIERVREHCVGHDVKGFSFAFHGGEPLLAGKEFFSKFITKANKVLSPVTRVTYLVQTNATLLTESWCTFFDDWGVQIGISLDGTPEANDQFRIDHAGRGSYDRIVAGLRLAQQGTVKNSQPGILSVININADPVEIYNHFKSLEAENISFLLPDSNFDKLPPLPESGNEHSDTPYADWLIRLFDVWFKDRDNQLTIQYFRKIIHAVLGREVVSELIGTANNEVLIIETNGSIESLDVLKICGEGFTKNNANVLTCGLDEALQTPLANLYHLSHKKMCSKCASCPVIEICGGGYLPHRYSSKNGFNNPSVYCNDLLKLITHIQTQVINQLPAELLEETGISALGYEEAIEMLEKEFGKPFVSGYAEELESY